MTQLRAFPETSSTKRVNILLVRLLVKNFGIIDEIDWSPGEKLNIITGETGAGKSLVIDAISALLSGKLDETDIRHGAGDCRVEGVFDLSGRTDLADALAAQGIELEDGTLTVSLSLKRGSRPAVRLNGAIAQRSFARELGPKLVELHGQSQHLSLLEPSSHLDYLDSYAGTLSLRHDFSRAAQNLSNLKNKITNIAVKEAEMARQQDFLNFQLQEIERAALAENEDSLLEEERTILASAERLKALAQEAEYALDGEGFETPVMHNLSRAAAALEKLAAIDGRAKPQAEVVRNTLLELTEAVREVRSYALNLDADPSRLEELEARIGLIRDLKRKYGGSIPSILGFADKIRRELEASSLLDDRKNGLVKEAEATRRELVMLGISLSEKRHAGAIKLSQAVNLELKDLGMGNARFSVSIRFEDSADGLPLPNSPSVKYDLTGADKVEFLVSTNPGEPFLPLIRIASTGELSRFTLAVKTALAESDRVPVLIFDEIDIGVGGRSGEIIGRKLSALSLSHQVICVTHLPQIACYGSRHFKIIKVHDGERVTSALSELTGNDLLTELAAMLSGQNSRAAADAARELIEKAAAFTESLRN
ncbi:DNA repair protein RecN (Recombination protein N) [Dehalogenimonas formicexedens]|uniref:DNA repair protein RecN n=1 Tax=Dehalogenimonas formicexedens TaxID=1839801 RepID=A0A1P8F6A9_9CHLR|nr:DNA repair protein RecN (Recombination protein N) [Dehalogenimonas formicexedens]